MALDGTLRELPLTHFGFLNHVQDFTEQLWEANKAIGILITVFPLDWLLIMMNFHYTYEKKIMLHD